MQIIFLISKLNTASSKILFFRQLSLNGIKLDPEIQNVPSLNIFKKNILKFRRPTPKNIFSLQNLKGIKYLISRKLGLSHLHEHKFKNNFQDSLNPLCTRGCNVENTCDFLLHCPNFLSERNTILNKITNIVIF